MTSIQTTEIKNRIVVESGAVKIIAFAQQGPPGVGVPVGGTTGQVLAKNSNTNYDTEWIDVLGGLAYQGTWNASTNSPALTSSVGTNGYYYVVSVAGSTNLNGITDWQINDWAIFNGTAWQKIDNSEVALTWGSITGTLSNQTDLQAALDAKQNSLGYTPENVANKQTDLTASATKYPTVNAVNTGLATKEPTFTELPVAKGGFGQSMAESAFTTTSSTNNAALTPGYRVFRGSTTGSIAGFAAPSPASSVITLLHNDTSNSLQILHESSVATAANRIKTMTASTMVMPAQSFGMLIYSPADSRWHFTFINTVNSVSSPLLINATTGALSIQNANSSQSGAATAAQVTSWDAKIGGAGVDKAVAFFTATNAITGDQNFMSFNPTTRQFGVQVTAADSEAVIHAKSDVAQTLADPVSATAQLIEFVLPASPNSVNYTPVTPDLARPQGFAYATNIGGGSYSGGDIVDFEIRPLYDDGAGGVTYGVAVQQITSINDVNNFDIYYNWTAVIPTQNFTANKWQVLRQVNAGGYTDWQEFTVPNGTDSNSGWTTGTPPLHTPANDFLANGTTYGNNFYGTKNSPISTTIISGAYPSSYTDSNTGDAYKLDIAISGGDTDDGYNIDWNGTGYINASSGTITGAGPASFPAGSPTTTPTTYGYQSDGSALNRSYDFYNIQLSPLLYSVNPISQSVTDPNDAKYYYVELSFNTSTGYSKIVNTSNATGKVASATVLDDGVTSFPDGTGHSPTSLYAPALKAEGDVILGETSSNTLGFFGATGAARATGGSLTAGGTYNSTVQGMINTLWQMARSYNLLS